MTNMARDRRVAKALGIFCREPVPGEGQNICTRDRGHAGPHRCKAADVDARASHAASRAEQHERYIDCGPLDWDDCG